MAILHSAKINIDIPKFRARIVYTASQDGLSERERVVAIVTVDNFTTIEQIMIAALSDYERRKAKQ